MIELKDLKQEIDNLIFYLDDVAGYKIYRQILKEGKTLRENDPEFQAAFIKLRFLSFPFLNEREAGSLLKENMSIGLNIPELDLKERLTRKLLFANLEERDAIKGVLKNFLTSSQEQITGSIKTESGAEIKSVSDWLKDYEAEAGGGAKSLKEAQYFQKKYVRGLSEEEKSTLKKLFVFYNALKASSFSPEGFEDDLLLEDEQGKLITTKKGQVVVLYDPANKKGSGSPVSKKTESPSGLEEKPDLQSEINKYPEGSLERKALEEELAKLRAQK